MSTPRGLPGGATPTGSVWGDVAASGTDPDAVAHVVALCTEPEGRSVLRADPHAAAERRVTAAARTAAHAAAARWRELGVRVTLPGDPTWPTGFGRLPQPPPFLAVRGASLDDERAAVAIVGARRATPYGTGVASWLAEAAGAVGAVVVSGGARGVDAAAHSAASDDGTVVVLGCGHAVRYPRQHDRPGGLFEAVLAGGGSLVSEQLPTMRPHPGVVRARNRLVAALADVVVVVEGGERSGSLLTSTAAAEFGVDVLAVPGDVRAAGSSAPHRLLREGAGVCADPSDLLAALAAARPLTVRDGVRDAASQRSTDPAPVAARGSVLPPALHDVLASRWPRPVHTGSLAGATGLGIGTVLAAVTRGVVAGELAEGPEGVRLRRAPDPHERDGSASP